MRSRSQMSTKGGEMLKLRIMQLALFAALAVAATGGGFKWGP